MEFPFLSDNGHLMMIRKFVIVDVALCFAFSTILTSS